nr:U24_MYRTX_Ta1a [Tetramorium africanum]
MKIIKLITIFAMIATLMITVANGKPTQSKNPDVVIRLG